MALLNVPQSQISRLAAAGIPDLAVAVTAFRQALADHAKTVGVPAPVAPDPLIDLIVRQHDGAFEIEPPAPPPSDPPPTRPEVRKSTVQARIIAAGRMGPALDGLLANPEAFAKWFAPDWPTVFCDDAEAIAFVQALGLDPTVILTPDAT